MIINSVNIIPEDTMHRVIVEYTTDEPHTFQLRVSPSAIDYIIKTQCEKEFEFLEQKERQEHINRIMMMVYRHIDTGFVPEKPKLPDQQIQSALSLSQQLMDFQRRTIQESEYLQKKVREHKKKYGSII